jgi:putative transposase
MQGAGADLMTPRGERSVPDEGPADARRPHSLRHPWSISRRPGETSGGVARFAPEGTVLFVHGATYPAETAFDLQLDGFSGWTSLRHGDSMSFPSMSEATRDPPGRRFFRRLLKGLDYVPRVIVTDKLQSYGVARRQLLPTVEHRQSQYLNNRLENSHRPTRRRERQMQRFKSPEQAQHFLSAHAFIHGHFLPRRHLLAGNSYRATRTEAFNSWQQETCGQQVA